MVRSLAIRNICYSAVFLAIGMVLPFFTGQIPQIGQMLLPLHLPVLICGLVCGPFYGGVIGVVLPLLRSFVFGMPPLFPTAITMAAEMAIYGITIGLLIKVLVNSNGKKERPYAVNALIALIGAMIAGRIVWGAVSYILLGTMSTVFTFEMFLAGAFITAVPGIILQLVLVPSVVAALKAAGVRTYK